MSEKSIVGDALPREYPREIPADVAMSDEEFTKHLLEALLCAHDMIDWSVVDRCADAPITEDDAILWAMKLSSSKHALGGERE